MDVVYVDRLFLLNLAADYFLLLATARLCPHRARRWRLLLGAALGALYAAGTLLPVLPLLRTVPMKLLCGLGMALTAFGGQGKPLRTGLVFFSVTAAFGGAVLAVSLLFGSPVPGRAFVPVSLPMLAVSFSLSYPVISLVFRRIGARAERQLLHVEITLGGRSAVFDALADTGNALCDPVSGTPVIAAETAALSPLLPPGTALSGDAEADFLLLSADDALKARLRLIPYAAVGVSSGLLLALRPDSIRINGKGAEAALVAFAPNALSPDGEYQAVV